MWINHANGMRSRPVFYNGKQFIVAQAHPEWRPGANCLVACYSSNGDRYPRSFGVASPPRGPRP